MTTVAPPAPPVELSGADRIAYGLLHQRAVLLDRSARFRMTFAGEKAAEALDGLLSNAVKAIAHGKAARAVALTPKGRVIALVRVVDRGSDLLVDGDGAAGAGFIAMVRKFVNPRLAKYSDVTTTTRCLGVYGPRAAEAVAGLDLAGITHIESTDFGVPGVDLVGDAARITQVEELLHAQGIERASDAVATVARIERGLPAFGVEMDEETIPQEANLGAFGALAFDKGCYTGQEVVARIHFRGHVNRHLRWLTAAEPLAVGAMVVDGEGKEVGQVRSSVVSPQRGALAIAMVRREVAPGSEVRVREAAGDASREVSARLEEIV